MKPEDRPVVFALYAVAVAVPTTALISLWLADLYRWQTLIAGALAIVAALIGGYFINKQIRQSERQELERLIRRHAAARAVMPLALSALCEYATSTAAILRDLRSRAVQERIPPTPPAQIPVFPHVPSEVITAFTNIIETFPIDKSTPFAEILSKLQIQSGRIRSLCTELPRADHVETLSNIELYIIDCAGIYARCELLFCYARRQTEQLTKHVESSDLDRALWLMGFWREENERLFNNLNKTAESAKASH